MTGGFPAAATTRPLWLVTLADLALLLLGFVMLMQATDRHGRAALAAALRERFAAAAAPAAAMPVASAGLTDFAPGSARLPGPTATLLAWAREAARDPRVTLTVTGWVDGSPADRDPASGSAALLAADRARAVAAVLAGVVPADRLVIATSARPGQRAALATLAFTGEAR